MSSSLHSANPVAILFVHNQCNYDVIELLWFVIALFGININRLSTNQIAEIFLSYYF